jgi:hypothetical protein
MQSIPASHILFPPILNDLLVKVGIEKGWRVDAVGFNHLEGLSKEGSYSTS